MDDRKGGMDLHQYEAHRKTATTPYGDFAYAEVGEGPPVLFVHGLFVSGYMWRDVMEALQGERRCIAYDLPAHGRTRVSPEQDLSLPAQADMLDAFRAALDLDEVDLVANDTGGAVAQVFAARHPRRVRTLTLTNCEARDVLPSPNELAQLIASLAAKGEFAPAAVEMAADPDAARGEVGLGAALEHPERLTEDDLRGYHEEHFSTLDNARQVERFLLSLQPDQLTEVEPELRRLEAPTLVVWGTGDEIFDIELAYWLRDAIPGCRDVVEVEGGMLFWPGERADELVAPLRELWAASAAPAR
jgi:pimeloyl-ACP methyl ester carboxylesterase